MDAARLERALEIRWLIWEGASAAEVGKRFKLSVEAVWKEVAWSTPRKRKAKVVAAPNAAAP